MKIVHCLFSMNIGGAQVLAVDLLNEMCENHDVSLIIVNKFNKNLVSQIDKRVKIYYIHRKEGSRNPLPILKLNLLLFHLRPDIIHCHEPNMVKALKTGRAKLVMTIHDVGIPVSFYDLYDSLVAISDAVYLDVTSRCTLPVRTAYNGIPEDLFQKRLNYAPEKEQQFRLVQVSRLVHEKKGHDILLHALNKIVHEDGFGNVSLDIIGEGSSYEYLNNLVKTLGLEAHVNFIGEKNRVWLFNNLCSYHVLVQPSRFEGFGLTILEGFAAGLPVLASDIDGPAEIMANTPGGFLFKNGDIASCAVSLHKIFTMYQNNEIAPLMNVSIPLIKQKYSIKSCAKEYLEEYSRLRYSNVSPAYL